MTEDLKTFLEETAKGAGEILRRNFGKIKHWKTKSGPGDIVTEIDYESERYILERIRHAFPNDNIISEETGKIIAAPAAETVGEKRVWYVDPIDGTRNFALGIPFFCVSIGVSVNDRMAYGAIYDPTHDDFYYAERGKGASINGKPIHVSKTDNMLDAVVSISWARPKADYRRFVEYIRKVSEQSSYFRRLGSAALVMCYVATGKIDAYLQGGLSAWDIAAGIVLIEEAGGIVTDFCGNPLDLNQEKLEVLTGNPTMHEMFVKNICGCKD